MDSEFKSPGEFPILMSPLRVGRTVWRNRIQTGPMSLTELGPGETLSRENIAFYERFAKGGAAVVTVGESIVPTTNGKTHPHMIMLGNPEAAASLVRVCDAIHAHGALADIEISHGGYMADPIYNDGNRLIGPVGLYDDYAGEVLGMDEAMIDEVADAFAEAAALVKGYGFDMAMIHAGHGWLLNQFLSPKYNTRDDAWGGASAQNRMRFPLLVLQRVRERVGRDYTLDMRVSGSEFLEGGAGIEDCVAFCREAQRYVDVINVSAGAPWTKRMVPSVFEARGINAVFAQAVRGAVDIPVTTVGGFADPRGMEQTLAEGMADGIILGRGIVAEPDLPNKIRDGRAATIRQCLRCFVCNENLYTTRNLRCAVNPDAGRELQTMNAPSVAAAADRRKVLVAGGGPGGMAAAIAAARRGHEVTLFEKNGALGGALLTEAAVPFKQDMIRLAEAMAAELDEVGVRVLLDTPLTLDRARAENADALIAALGARPVIPPIEGAKGANVYTAERFAADSDVPARAGAEAGAGTGVGAEIESGTGAGAGAVAIVGGGLVGSELALHLAMQGRSVTLLEMQDEIAVDATSEYRRFLLAEIEKFPDLLHVRTGARASRITADGVVCADGETIPASTVILAVGYAPLLEEAEALRPCARIFRNVGDSARVARVYEAIRAGTDAGRDI